MTTYDAGCEREALARCLGQECRIARAYRTRDGQMTYALKTASETVAVSKDKALLIDIAEARYMRLTEIAD